jgi:hypothetical protein
MNSCACGCCGANDLGRAAVELEDYLLQVIGEAQSAARRFPPPHSFRARNLAQQQALTPAFASALGYRNELRALVRRLPEEMHALLRELQTLAREANLKLNDPGRYGDAAASVPINDLSSFVFGVLAMRLNLAAQINLVDGALPRTSMGETIVL